MDDHDQPCARSVLASLIGSAIGDARGLPYENLSARRGRRLLGSPDRFRLLPGRGMVSDDAEHACMTCAAFAESGGDVDRFRKALARRLRWWIVTIPVGVGLATLKSTLKLWLGISPARSGTRSAGNGPAMRAAILGRLVGDRHSLLAFVTASTLITHRDDRAIAGAYAVAVASAQHARASPGTLDEVVADLQRLAERGMDVATTVDAIRAARESVAKHESTQPFAARVCRRPGRVSGYILETVPVALHAAFSSANAEETIRATIECGGDTDSVASIAAGIVGTDHAAAIDELLEWPCDLAWLRRLAEAGMDRTSPPPFPVVRRWPRNLLLLVLVLLHVVRRCLPPY